MTNKKYYLLAIFAALAFIQLCVPLYMALKWENVLKDGQPFFLETAPVDPYDAFRGRYIVLGFKENTGMLAADSLNVSFEYRQPVYALLETNSGGFGFIKEVSVNKPVEKPYVKAKFLGLDQKTSVVRVALPFNRYYVPEPLAQEAEDEMRRQARNKKSAVALLRVKDGYGAIENIYFENKPLLEYLREQR
jgi:uncharacterized membrane-anchored protein